MRKIFATILCVLVVLCLSACGGNVSNVRTHDVGSAVYSQDEIDSAIDVIKQEFKSGWKGCTLTEIYYAGDKTSAAHSEWADRYDADEAIVLTSSFAVDSSGGDGSLNPNSTYDGWMWILVRTAGGQWQHVDHGY